jgi:photoactive yellow protein
MSCRAGYLASRKPASAGATENRETGMTKQTADFDAPDLAAQLEQLSEAEIDALPFGVIHLDRTFRVVLYSKPEARMSGFGRQPIGEKFFDYAPRLGGDDFRGRIEQMMADGAVDLDIGWVGDFNDPKRDLRIRVQSASDGGIWMCVDRDPRSIAGNAR